MEVKKILDEAIEAVSSKLKEVEEHLTLISSLQILFVLY